MKSLKVVPRIVLISLGISFFFLVASVSTVFAQAVDLTILNIPPSGSQIVLVSGDPVLVEFTVIDPTGLNNNDEIRLVRVDNGTIVSSKKRGNNSTGNISLSTKGNDALGNLKVEYENNGVVITVTPNVPIEEPIFVLADAAVLALVDRVEALEATDPVPGPPGADGADGAPGADGADGAQGIPGVAGADGADGAPGADGADGAQGIPGVAGADGADGAPGADGADGAQGIPGVAGADGADGAPGADGADGAQGIPGVAGADGADGAPGADGADGAQGIPGVAGADGADGAPGADGADGAQGIPGVAGADGADGAPGADGADGAQGIPGVAGADGADGAPGADGADGAQVIPGVAGIDGLNCWDLNVDGICNITEDITGDSVCDATDCQGWDTDWTESDGNVYRLGGKVGIGTTNPYYPFTVEASSPEYVARIGNTASVGHGLEIIMPDGNPSYTGLTVRYGYGGPTKFQVLGNGNVLVYGTLIYSSDNRVKKNIQPITNALEKTVKLRGVSWNWENESMENGSQMGVVAQEIEQVLPELVRTDKKTGMKSVAYSQLNGVLIEAIKDLNKQNKELQSRIEALEKK